MLFIVIEPYGISHFWNFWNGLNNELSSRIYSTLQTCTRVCVWSPEQHHPKSLTLLMQRTIVDMGMKTAHICFGKQLYDMTIQVCWNQPRQFQNIVYPARMYIIAIFACIGTLMKCSVWEVYVSWRNKRYLQ